MRCAGRDMSSHLGSRDAVTLSRAHELSHPESTFICVDLDLQALRANPARMKVVADAAACRSRVVLSAICSEHLLEHLSDPQGVFRNRSACCAQEEVHFCRTEWLVVYCAGDQGWCRYASGDTRSIRHAWNEPAPALPPTIGQTQPLRCNALRGGVA